MKTIGVLALCCLALAVEGHRFRRLAEGAEPAQLGEFPYLVSIQVGGQHICGGSLISTSHVLTAAHCVADLVAQRNPLIFSRLSVEVGSIQIGAGQSHAVQRIAHRKDFVNAAEYNPYTILNDMAVITLKTPVQTSAYVSTISLPTEQTRVPINSVVTVAGYGSKKYGQATSSTLKKLSLVIVSNQECDQYYSSALRKRVSDNLLCAKLAPGYGTCAGDSGGPLIFEGKLVAIVSGGDGMCGAGNPDFFTEVSFFLQFIRRAMQGPAQYSPDTTELDAGELPAYQPPAQIGQQQPNYPMVEWYPWQPQQGGPVAQPPVILIPQWPVFQG